MSHRDPRNDPPSAGEDAPSDGRREFLRTTVAAAIGVGAVAILGESVAAAAPSASTTTFEFDSQIVPAALTKENIKKITDAIAAKLAQEAKVGIESVPQNFHLRIGGGHSRTFSKTGDHKNVGHSEVIIDGSLP